MTTLIDELRAHQLNKNDKRVFGLVLQGGGMRAVYSAGAVRSLIDYGYADTFEHIIGSSAGAINGAYFLSADRNALNTYTDDLTNGNFINLLRWERKVDIDYLVDLVMRQKHPVNIARLLKSKSQLHIVMTDAKTGKKVVVSDHRKFIEIYEEFRATAALPLLYDKPVLVGGRWYIDGGVSDLVPLDIAVRLGCTDIVVVLTQRLGNFRFDRKHTRLVNHLVKHFAKNQPDAIRKILPTNERMLKINLRTLAHPNRKTRFYVLEPSEENYLISLVTIDRTKVEKLGRLGVTDMDQFLQKPLQL